VLIGSGVAIMLALYNSMDLRRRQIAVLRVLGASGVRIFGLVVTESTLIGIMGAVAGIVLGWAGSHVAAMFMKDQLGLVVRPELTPAFLVLVTVGTVVLSTLAGVIPAIKAYRTSVCDHLRPIG
jgi:putative ABC transport system permease protein